MSDLLKLAINARPISVPKKEVGHSKEKKVEEKSDYYRRGRAALNYIPTPDQLSRLIERALEALSRGVYWDRGSILNIVL